MQLKTIGMVFSVVILVVPGFSLVLRTGRDLSIGSEGTIINDDIIALARSIKIKGVINGDIFACAQEVEVTGKVNGTIFVSGAEIKIYTTGTRTILAFCSQLDVSGAVDNNILFLGKRLDTDSTFFLKKDFWGYGKEINLNGDIKGTVKGAAKIYDIGGNVQDGEIEGSEVNIKSTACIKGHLIIKSEKEPTIDSAAKLVGKVEFQKITEKPKVGKKGSDFMRIMKIIFFISELVIGLVLIALFKDHFKKMSRIFKTQFWKNLGLGFLILAVIPVAIVIALLTIIGFPVAIFGLFLFFTLAYLSSIVFATGFGDLLIKLFKRGGEVTPFISFILGLVIITLVSMIPYLGFLIRLVVLFVGTGILVILLYKLLKGSGTILEAE
ncbi:MAG: hypothetical protein ABIL39_00870 [candidate division WOR-3 bacterium]